MMRKKTSDDSDIRQRGDALKGEPLDVAAILDKYEEKPIVPSPDKPDTSTAVVPAAGSVVAPVRSGGQALESRLKDDLKLSYEARGILDITAGGYGFLRHDWSCEDIRYRHCT